MGVPAADDHWSTLPPEEEVLLVAAAFDSWHSGLDSWEWAGSPKRQWGLARVCRVMPQRVLHVIGASAMAERPSGRASCSAPARSPGGHCSPCRPAWPFLAAGLDKHTTDSHSHTVPTPQPPKREGRFHTVATSLLAAAVLGGVILLLFLSYDVNKSDFTVSHGTLPGERWQGMACTYYLCAAQHVDWRWTLDPGAQIATTFTTDATTHDRLLGHELQLDNDGECTDAALSWTIAADDRPLGSGVLDATTPSTRFAFSLPDHGPSITVTAARRDAQSCPITVIWRDAIFRPDPAVTDRGSR
ncbi:hypothetical protein [Amycolatopsis magusensis]|uniref:hypothetical protein n=1 Tax=Amycolatopsis magusensis TaxID=882444 RepID=UPI0037A044C1